MIAAEYQGVLETGIRNRIRNNHVDKFSDREDEKLLSRIISSGKKKTLLPVYQKLREFKKSGDVSSYDSHKRFLEQNINNFENNASTGNYAFRNFQNQFYFLKNGTKLYEEYKTFISNEDTKNEIRKKTEIKSEFNSYINILPVAGPTGELLKINGNTMLHQRRSSLESLNGLMFSRYA